MLTLAAELDAFLQIIREAYYEVDVDSVELVSVEVCSSRKVVATPQLSPFSLMISLYAFFESVCVHAHCEKFLSYCVEDRSQTRHCFHNADSYVIANSN